MMTLDKILKDIKIVSFTGNRRMTIQGIAFDSRKVTEGCLFVAVRGTKSDGHDYIRAAIDAGAAAVICEKLPEKPEKNISWIITEDSATALGISASNFFGNPSASLKLTGDYRHKRQNYDRDTSLQNVHGSRV